MSRIILSTVCITVVMFHLYGEEPVSISFQWPVIKGEHGALRGITSTFGESRVDHFHAGVDIAGDGDPVKPLASGRILYSHFHQDHPFRPMRGPGNVVIVDHGQGFWSGYYHLKRTGETRSGPVRENTIIGYSGNTGRSGGPHLHFHLTRSFGLEYVNPLNYLPETKDENAPVIHYLVIITPEGETRLVHERPQKIRLTRKYPVYVNITDAGLEQATRRGIYKMSWEINGKSFDERKFDVVKSSDGAWLLGDMLPFEEVFEGRYYKLNGVEFADGDNTLKVSVADYEGNETTEVFNIEVKKQY